MYCFHFRRPPEKTFNILVKEFYKYIQNEQDNPSLPKPVLKTDSESKPKPKPNNVFDQFVFKAS